MARTNVTVPTGKSLYIDKPDDLAAVASELAQREAIAFDTEFLWERTYVPRLGLIQVADEESTWLVDPVAISPDEMRPLLDVLVSPDVLKVAHAIDQDQICLSQTYGISALPVFDTQIAAALCGMGDQVGLATLLKRLARVDLGKAHTRTNWLKRPLSSAMLKYAADDVAYLVRTSQILERKLQALGRTEWNLELGSKTGEAANALFDHERIASRLVNGRRLDARTVAVLKELVGWREDEARKRNLPRRWLVEDKLLVKLALAQPGSSRELESFRGLGRSLRPHSIKSMLRAIQRGFKVPASKEEAPPRRKPPTPMEVAAQGILRHFLTALAADKGVPLRLLVENDAMLGLLRGRYESVDALAASGLLTPKAIDLFGEDLVAILNGRRSLRLMNGAAVQQNL